MIDERLHGSFEAVLTHGRQVGKFESCRRPFAQAWLTRSDVEVVTLVRGRPRFGTAVADSMYRRAGLVGGNCLR